MIFLKISDNSILNPELKMAQGTNVVEFTKSMEGIANQNQYQGLNSFLGGGAYDHYIPSVVNYLPSRGEFLSAYTPYQPEMSQGPPTGYF